VHLLDEAIAAYRQALLVFTQEQLPRQWAQAQTDLALTFLVLEDWTSAAECYANVLKVQPNNKRAYETASFLEHEVLFNYHQAFELNESWLRLHPDDLWALASFAETHFTTGRFEQCAQRITTLLANEKLDVRAKIALRTIEIANLLALRQSSNVLPKMNLLIETVSAQATDFKVGRSVEGIKHFISHDERLKPSKDWLTLLFTAISSENRDSIVTGLKTLSANFTPQQSLSPNHSEITLLEQSLPFAALDYWSEDKKSK
jgi:tetratricopeptide (TPR) repeat protein